MNKKILWISSLLNIVCFDTFYNTFFPLSQHEEDPTLEGDIEILAEEEWRLSIVTFVQTSENWIARISPSQSLNLSRNQQDEME